MSIISRLRVHAARTPAVVLRVLPLLVLLAACGDTTPTGAVPAPPVPVDSAVATPPAPPEAVQHDVTIRTQLTGSTDPQLAAAVERAVRRWERALTTDLPDVVDSIAPGQCGAGVPGFAGRIDDLHVFVVVDSIDGPGRVLASGGPCGVREASLLPYVGVVTLDRSDLSVLLAVGGVDDLLAHELGHVLGIGVLWRDGGQGQLVRAPADGEPRFVGAGAREAAGRLGLEEEGARGIVIETHGGVGVAGMHWSEARYQRELMTGFLGGTGNVLSLVTILSLRDLGYGVTGTAAEPWTAEDAPGTPAAAGSMRGTLLVDGAAPLRVDERTRRPAWTIDRAGRRRVLDQGP